MNDLQDEQFTNLQGDKPVIKKGQHYDLSGGKKVAKRRGRKCGSSAFGEQTVRRRIPLSLVPVVDYLLSERLTLVDILKQLESKRKTNRNKKGV